MTATNMHMRGQSHNEDCCSEIKVVLDRTDKIQDGLKDVWSAVNGIRNRLPNWATFVFGLMTFSLGIAATIIARG